MSTTAAVVRERPILFSGEMVRAILDGRKTQTRRVVKPHLGLAGRVKEPGGHRNWHLGDPNAVLACPYGQPGDSLWVREGFADLTEVMGQEWERFNPETGLYERGRRPFIWYREDGEQPDQGSGSPINEPWRSPIRMPRWASRLTLEVTVVRVERVQEISHRDAIAEGIERHDDDGATYYGPYGRGHADPVFEFRRLWDSLNAKRGYGWDANPWVWVIEFRRLP